jgi:hypothetical protein
MLLTLYVGRNMACGQAVKRREFIHPLRIGRPASLHKPEHFPRSITPSLGADRHFRNPLRNELACSNDTRQHRAAVSGQNVRILYTPRPYFAASTAMRLITQFPGAYIEIPIKKSKAIPATGREMLRIPHCLDNRLTDGGRIVSLTYRPLSTP